MMRIITGSARGVRLTAPAGETTRPTGERAKEAIFSMLQNEIEGRRVLDLFAGSGQMGLEALSRGARFAVFSDTSREAVEAIRKNAEKTKLSDRCEICSADFHSFLPKLRKKDRFDLVILDPPYKAVLVPDALRFLDRYGLLLPGAILVCETGSADDVFAGREELRAVYRVFRESRYGAEYVTLLRYEPVEAGAGEGESL